MTDAEIKLQCLHLAQGNVEKAKELYNFVVAAK